MYECTDANGKVLGIGFSKDYTEHCLTNTSALPGRKNVQMVQQETVFDWLDRNEANLLPA